MVAPFSENNTGRKANLHTHTHSSLLIHIILEN